MKDLQESRGVGGIEPPGIRRTLMSGQAPVATVQPPGLAPSGLPLPPSPEEARTQPPTAADDAPYTGSHPSQAPLDQVLAAQSPFYGPAQPPYDRGDAMGESWVGRLQPPLGWSGGSYALNTAWDAGSPDELPDDALPDLRDGAFRFSQRLKSQGDQGVMDNLLRQGGSYLEVNQAPYWGDDRPAGR